MILFHGIKLKIQLCGRGGVYSSRSIKICTAVGLYLSLPPGGRWYGKHMCAAVTEGACVKMERVLVSRVPVRLRLAFEAGGGKSHFASLSTKFASQTLPLPYRIIVSLIGVRKTISNRLNGRPMVAPTTSNAICSHQHRRGDQWSPATNANRKCHGGAQNGRSVKLPPGGRDALRKYAGGIFLAKAGSKPCLRPGPKAVAEAFMSRR